MKTKKVTFTTLKTTPKMKALRNAFLEETFREIFAQRKSVTYEDLMYGIEDYCNGIADDLLKKLPHQHPEYTFDEDVNSLTRQRTLQGEFSQWGG